VLDVGGYTEERLVATLGEQVRDRVAQARQRLIAAGCPVPAVEARSRYAWIREATAGCVERPAHRPVTWTDRLDRVLTHRLWGTLFFLGLMFFLFESIYTGARPAMKAIDSAREWLGGLVAGSLPPGPFTSLLVEGVIGGVGAVVVFLPQILILFLFIALLEDCGYMARAAFLMDRLMARCGLSGKSFIPLLSSLACAVPGIMATRVIEERRDRLATILVAPLMSCSARLPVYILLIGAFFTEGYAWWVSGLVMFAMYLIGLITAPLVALVLKRTLLRGETPVFVMEMPAYKRPSLRVVFRRVLDSAPGRDDHPGVDGPGLGAAQLPRRHLSAADRRRRGTCPGGSREVQGTRGEGVCRSQGDAPADPSGETRPARPDRRLARTARGDRRSHCSRREGDRRPQGEARPGR
jgi:ferrous iron transport protein B